MSLFRSISAISAANAISGVLGLVLVPVALARLDPEGYALIAVLVSSVAGLAALARYRRVCA